MEMTGDTRVKMQPQVLKSFTKKSGKGNLFLILGSFLVVVAGVLTGWFLSGNKPSAKTESTPVEGTKQSETEAGLTDESLLPDNTEGKLVEGGIEGEGTHHLEREGGPSQNVYLTSTVIDLQSFVSKKVKVWGETLSAIHAGWLMDVGKIKVIE